MNLQDRLLDLQSEYPGDRMLQRLVNDLLDLFDPLAQLVEEAERAEPIPGSPLFNALYRVKDIIEPPITVAQVKAAQEREQRGWRGVLSTRKSNEGDQ